jgi:hypothetical protein
VNSFAYQVNFVESIVTVSSNQVPTSGQNFGQNYYICNNVFEGTYFQNPFTSGLGAGFLILSTTLFSNNTSGQINVYYQLNTHLASLNYIFELRDKDSPDVYIDLINANNTNIMCYFLDLSANAGSNFLKVLINYNNILVPCLRTVNSPFIQYSIQ